MVLLAYFSKSYTLGNLVLGSNNNNNNYNKTGVTEMHKITRVLSVVYRPVVAMVHSVARQPFANTLSAATGKHPGTGTVVVSRHAHPSSILQH